jgi:hypothetical protein
MQSTSWSVLPMTAVEEEAEVVEADKVLYPLFSFWFP